MRHHHRAEALMAAFCFAAMGVIALLAALGVGRWNPGNAVASPARASEHHSPQAPSGRPDEPKSAEGNTR